MRHRCKFSIVALLLSFAFAAITAAPSRALESTIKGTGAVTGKVTAGKPFTAAHVYLRGQDKPVTFMVFTAGGQYQAMNVLPGTYRISAERRGFAPVPQTITVKAGETVTADLSMNDGPDVASNVNGPATVTGYPGPGPIMGEVEFVSDYDKLYPPGPGRVVLERTCMACHGNNFYGLKQYDRSGWEAVVDMMSKRVGGLDSRVPPGKLSPKDREVLIDYMAANFGLDKKKRSLHTAADIPVDESVLGKAMLVEYDLPKANVANAKPRGQNPYFDELGNVWSTDRGHPNAVVKLDPRTVTFEHFPMPTQGGPHGITIDGKGAVWIGETVGFSLTRLDPDSGKFERFPIDPRGFIKGRGHDPIVDKDQNVWLATIVGNQLTKFDRKTGKIVNYEPPTANSFPYGLDKDKDGNIWISQFVQCRIAKFNPTTEEWTEYPVLTAYNDDPFCTVRRPTVGPDGTIWYGIFNKGIIGKLDPATGKMVEYKVPMATSEPYDVWPDPAGNIWISDGGMGGTLIRFDPKTETFAFYPTVQRGDLPKIEITREGAVWYNPRSAVKGAVGVLYPDMTKMTGFEAKY
jgi:virginiamycin B lyase